MGVNRPSPSRCPPPTSLRRRLFRSRRQQLRRARPHHHRPRRRATRVLQDSQFHRLPGGGSCGGRRADPACAGDPDTRRRFSGAPVGIGVTPRRPRPLAAPVMTAGQRPAVSVRSPSRICRPGWGRAATATPGRRPSGVDGGRGIATRTGRSGAGSRLLPRPPPLGPPTRWAPVRSPSSSANSSVATEPPITRRRRPDRQRLRVMTPRHASGRPFATVAKRDCSATVEMALTVEMAAPRWFGNGGARRRRHSASPAATGARWAVHRRRWPGR